MPIAGDDTPGTISPELADLLRKMLLGEPAPNPNTPPDDSWWARDEDLPWPHPLLANESTPPRPDVPPPSVWRTPWWVDDALRRNAGTGLPPEYPVPPRGLPDEWEWDPDGYETPIPPGDEETSPELQRERALWGDEGMSTFKRNMAIGGGASLVGLLALLLSKIPQAALGGGVMGMPSNMLPPQGPNTLA